MTEDRTKSRQPNDERVYFTAPFTKDQVENMNAHQTKDWLHPFTCPHREPETHGTFNGDMGALVATVDGWVCPWCDYRQYWAHPFQTETPANPPEIYAWMRDALGPDPKS